MNCENRTDLRELFPRTENHCPVDHMKQIMTYAKEHSCGTCVLCREGSIQVQEILKDITKGNPQKEDLELIQELCQLIHKNGSCEMIRMAAELCLTSLEEEAEEWELHVRRKKCSAQICEGSSPVVEVVANSGRRKRRGE